jgi:fibronectin type 3 domain-containing protein
VEASDLAGYRVYRRGPESDELKALHDDLVTRTELIDEDVTADATYTYRVRAVDRSGNESELSEPADATVR